MEIIERSSRANPLTVALAETDSNGRERIPIGNGRTALLVDGEKVDVVYIDQGMAYVSLPSTESDKADMRVPREMIEKAAAQLDYVEVFGSVSTHK